MDMLVHGQDIARPLGRPREMPAPAVAAALDHAWGSSFYGARKRFAGLRLRATDPDWSAGEGEEVRGPAADLLLLATGRPAGLDALDGPGVTQAAARVG
ncbi:maleylpyruvate isomerase family mycothiol-dependent enzyme [Pseudonocardia halophobica]|uniref:maleylpyruvate isomerase family mycothiol-dependent enzyme n=1 Tax=Pseudonocardia halophobica TaxID=29401 RepID=UPI00068FD4F2|nr:maleylpyruvate isomerase family mycothiol-dependent enzyme [Pseudonocardia halophobica]